MINGVIGNKLQNLDEVLVDVVNKRLNDVEAFRDEVLDYVKNR